MDREHFRVLIVDSTNTFGGAFEVAVTLVDTINGMEPGSVGLESCQPREILDERVPHAFHHHSRLHSYKFTTGGMIPLLVNTARNFAFREAPAAIQLARTIRDFGADIVHPINFLHGQMYAAAAARMTGRLCVSTHQEFGYPTKLLRMVEPLVHRHVAISSSIKQHLVDVLGFDDSKVSLIYNPIDTARFRQDAPPADISARFAIPAERKVFAIFGRLVPWKGQDTFLRAAKLVLEEIPDAHALIVGDASSGGDAFETTLHDLVRQLEIADRVTFAGYQSDIPQLMRASAVVVHASTRPEPFGLVVGEAMACGRPCVAMDEGGPVDMIEPGKQGLLVRPSQPEAMARAIITLLAHPEIATAMGAAARVRCVEHFSAPIIARLYVELFESLLERPRGRVAGFRRRPSEGAR